MDKTADGMRFERVTMDDFDDIVGLTAEAWYSPEGCGDLAGSLLGDVKLTSEERTRISRLMATDETAAYLADMTWGCKATLNGRVVGVIITYGSRVDETASVRWAELGADARREAEAELSRIRGHESRESEPSEPIYLDEVRATEEMREEAGLEGQPRVLLLVIGAAARGHGLGRRLLDQARAHFLRHGAKHYWLVTDTTCDWPFYEHLGLVRLAERPGTVAGAPDWYYVYGGRA